ncbi:hypothetical protein EGW08_007971, partial [Elysia chlorotica]
ATQYMKHAKRRRMSTEDLNKAAVVMGLMPVSGHGSQEPAVFRNVKDADVHCVDDPEINITDIALGNYVPRQIGQPSIKGLSEFYINLNGFLKKKMSSTHLKYYNLLTKALLGANAEAKKKALQDLRTNPNLIPVLPYLVNFVVSGIKNMSHDIGQLTTMLNTVRALIHNRSLYLMHKPYLNTIVQGVEFCVLETLAASISSVNDHWVLRDSAARLLAEIVNRWNSPQNHLRSNTIKLLKEVLHDTTKPFYSHYGAVMSLIALGHKAIEDVILPHLPTYWPHLQAAMEDQSSEHVVNRLDSQKVYGALRVAAEKSMRRHIRRFEEQSVQQKERDELAQIADAGDITVSENKVKEEAPPSSAKQNNVSELYQSLYEYFGDSLAHCLPVVDTHGVFKPCPKDDLVSLGDHNSGKSGEVLLENLMEQIKQQEKLEQERKEREQKEQREREKREKERRARQAIEQKKREEEERKERLRRVEEDQKKRRLEALDEERQKWKEDEERRQKEWEEQMKELNKNRNKPQWQQQIELRRMQLEEEMQYSRMLEASKRQEGRERARREEEEEKARRQREEEELLRRKEEEDELAGRSRVGLRRRKPVNYTEKDEDISDLFDSRAAAAKRRRGGAIGHPFHPRGGLKLGPNLPPHSDISDDSDSDIGRRLAAGLMSPASAEAAIAVSKVIDPSKGLLKLKIRRQGGHGTGTPPHPMSSSGTPQHTPSSSFPYHSPSMTSPLYSPHSVSIPTPPPANYGAFMSTAGTSGSAGHQRSKSSSGSEKESKHKRSSESGSHPRAGSTGIQDISDPDEPFTMDPPQIGPTSLHPMYSPGGESSGSDSNPHRKALKLKLKLTPKDSASE